MANFIKLKDGKFWDGRRNEFWFPAGVAYQLWIRDTGVWQTREQIIYDLDQMQELGANSLRIDFTWKTIEYEYWDYAKLSSGQWDDIFRNHDFFMAEASKRNFRLFPVIGYQWPPEWFPEEAWTGHQPDNEHSQPWKGKTISFENEKARELFGRYICKIIDRYKHEESIAAWVLGNEHSYIDLIEMKQKGYDAGSQKAFRKWLEWKYGSIENLNSVWRGPRSHFEEIEMPHSIDYKRWSYHKHEPCIYDLMEWREHSIADFVALTARLVHEIDPNHLITYAGIGMIWGEEDFRYLGEDAAKIAAACSGAGAPLDFWSINNYCMRWEGSETVSGKMGYVKARHDSGLPVLCTETGFTTSETMWHNSEEQQGTLLKGAILEAIMCNAMGVFVFTWQDRPYNIRREQGFGIVYPDRKPKPAYWAMKEVFQLIKNTSWISQCEAQNNPPQDIAFLWTDATDAIYNRYKVEMSQIFGVLERLGYKPGFVGMEELRNGKYSEYKLLILPRNERMFDEEFDLVFKQAITQGITIFANGGLPGLQDEYGRYKPERREVVEKIFGVKIDKGEMFETPTTSLFFKKAELDLLDANFIEIFGKIEEELDVWKFYKNMYASGCQALAEFSDKHLAVSWHENTMMTAFCMGDLGPFRSAFEKRQRLATAIFKQVLNLKPAVEINSDDRISVQTLTVGGKPAIFIKNCKTHTASGLIKYAETGQSAAIEAVAAKTFTVGTYGSLKFNLQPMDSEIYLIHAPNAKPAVRLQSENKPEPKIRISREEAFPSRVAVYKSFKSLKTNPALKETLDETLELLKACGYEESKLGIYEKTKGYYLLDDEMAGDDGKLLNLNHHYLSEFYNILILPAAEVLSNEERENIKVFLENAGKAVIVMHNEKSKIQPDFYQELKKNLKEIIDLDHQKEDIQLMQKLNPKNNNYAVWGNEKAKLTEVYLQ